MWRLFQEMYVNVCQVTDHVCGWNERPIHRSRNCLYCPTNVNEEEDKNHVNYVSVKRKFKCSVIPASFPTDADYEICKNNEKIQVRRALWIGNHNQRLSAAEKEFRLMLHTMKYNVISCENPKSITINPCRRLLVFSLNQDNSSLMEHLLPHVMEVRKCTVFVTLKSCFSSLIQWNETFPLVRIILHDMESLRAFHLLLLNCIFRCTVRQLKQVLPQDIDIQCSHEKLWSQSLLF